MGSDEALFQRAVISYFLIGPPTYISCRYITAPYGKHHRQGWGPTLPPSLAWFLMESPTLWFTLLLFPFGQHSNNPKSLLLISPFILHYFHRTVIYPLRLHHKPSNAGYPITVALIAFFYNIFNSYLQARWGSCCILVLTWCREHVRIISGIWTSLGKIIPRRGRLSFPLCIEFGILDLI
ncbi:hypothetical protein M8C21_026631, partial [Ambrosia artemisiifolia]